MSGKSWLFLSVVLVGCGAPKTDTAAADRVAAALTRVLDSTFAAAPQVPGLILRVEAPSIGLSWAKAVGYFDKAAKTPLEPSHTMRLASNTKTYVATAILRLVEDGKLGLDSTIGRYLLPASVAALKRGGYDPAKITVRMMLQHTSGLFDYAMSDAFARQVFGNFPRRWTRAEQLALAVDSGKPYGPPDSVYHYSDTGYILLGEILETITGSPMSKAVHDLVDFDRLGIKSTYFETLDSVPPGTPPRAHQYLDSTDTYGLDASHDLYGGGGIVSNGENVVRFYRALVRGEIFRKKETLDLMLAVSPQSANDGGASGYGMGIGRGEIAGVACYGHSGFWGTVARYCPSVDVGVFVATNRATDQTTPALAKAALAVVVPALTPAR